MSKVSLPYSQFSQLADFSPEKFWRVWKIEEIGIVNPAGKAQTQWTQKVIYVGRMKPSLSMLHSYYLNPTKLSSEKPSVDFVRSRVHIEPDLRTKLRFDLITEKEFLVDKLKGYPTDKTNW